jgi:tetratricopeptide (TPR) repeat protein
VSLVVIPSFLLLLVEAGLRVSGYGFPTRATVATAIGGVPARGDNVKFGWRFFPRNIAQEFDPFVFRTAKASGVYRVFVLGASAAQGTPDPAYSFGRILEVMLDDAYAPADAEVTVVAMPAINSHAVVEIAADLAEYGPDLFVVYLGNNEVVGPYGPGTVFAPLSPSRALIRMGLRLRETRTGQFLANGVGLLKPNADAPRVWQGMEMFLRQQVAADDPRLPMVYEHFRRNLESIRDVARENSAAVVFCTVGSNLKDCPPFASRHRADITEEEKTAWRQLYQEAMHLEASGKYHEAVQGYVAAEALDGCFADLQFRLARCYWLAGEREKARDKFFLARHLDTLRFRPDERINEAIRAVASTGGKEDVYLVDIDEMLRRRSAFGVPGREFFYEHVHLNFHGNYLVARAIFEQIVRLRTTEPHARERRELEALAESQCAERLAYNDWARYNVLFKVLNYYLKEPPFTHQLYHEEQVASLERQVQSLEAGLTDEVRAQIAGRYRDLMARKPSDIWLRLRFAEFSSVQLGDALAAVGQCERVSQLAPHSYKPLLLLALSLGRLNRIAEAIPHLRRVVEIKPTCAQAFHLLGVAYQSRRQWDQALAAYRRAVKLRPDNIEARRQMVEILAAQGNVGRAENVLRQALSAAPQDASLHQRLGVLLRQQGRREEAAKAFEAAAGLRESRGQRE